MKLKKMTAVVMTAAMVLGNSTIALAAETDTATGTGESFDHLNKEITTVTLPLDSAVANVFNYYVDPEGLVKDAGKLTDGTAVDGNTNGVYFHNTSGYSSTSDEVEFEGKNSVDVDITVVATVEGGDKDIALVADEDALAAATTPALLMTLTVGENSTAITADGGSASEVIEGKAANFEVTVDNGAYAYTVKDGATGWDKIAISLSGKTNNIDVPDGEGAMTAPAITLKWTITKHVDGYVSANTMSATNNSVTVTLPDGVTVSSIKLLKSGATTPVNMVSGSHYTVSNGVYTFKKDMVSAWTGATITFTYSDGKSDVVTVQ